MDTILVADDNSDDLKLIIDILKGTRRYKVETATNPDRAMELLQPKKVKVAILDFRLNGGSEDDETGLVVAQESSHEIPKIIISGLADASQIRAAFGVDREGRPVVLDFLSKDDIRLDAQLLVKAVERAIVARSISDRRERESVRGQLLSDYRTARWFDLINTGVSFFVNLVFIALLVTTLHWIHVSDPGIVLSSIVAIGIVVSEIAINLFLAKRIEGSSRRAESYHTELLQAWRFEQLLKSADSLDYIKNRNQAKQEVITAFASRWNTDHSRLIGPAPDSSGSAPNA